MGFGRLLSRSQRCLNPSMPTYNRSLAFPANDLLRLTLEAADEVGVKLEMVGGLPIWEAMPGIGHQRQVKRIEASIARATHHGCIHYADLQIQFSDGSFKRPDISIFCREPEEQDGPVTLLPEAVIEVVCKGYEAKDYDIGLPFYQKMRIKDVVIFDPSRNHVLHARSDGSRELTSPAVIQLECGCVCTV
jgi:Uma2 family endonuclease